MARKYQAHCPNCGFEGDVRDRHYEADMDATTHTFTATPPGAELSDVHVPGVRYADEGRQVHPLNGRVGVTKYHQLAAESPQTKWTARDEHGNLDTYLGMNGR
jgi:hypothetical protein